MKETAEVFSDKLNRNVIIDLYQHEPFAANSTVSLLIINDGQDLLTMEFGSMLAEIVRHTRLKPLIIAAVHCSADRNNEYGMATGPDFKGWGTKGRDYAEFISGELIPLLHQKFSTYIIQENAIAGFSLGGLSALDIAWNHPDIFTRVGVFSGSLWWRSVDKGERNYDPWKHRMMHHQVASSPARPGMKFFFECGEHDETEDRNRNGVIDSIDDTIDIMRLLVDKGYREGKDFYYLQMPDGRHDVQSWAKALPKFIQWGWGE